MPPQSAWELVSPDSKLTFHFDPEGEDYYLDADHDWSSEVMEFMVSLIGRLGYELMSGEECEPDLFEDYVRIYVAKTHVSPARVLSLPTEFLVLTGNQPEEFAWKVG